MNERWSIISKLVILGLAVLAGAASRGTSARRRMMELLLAMPF